MHVFSRSIRLSPGDPTKQMDWALRVTEKVNQISEVPIRLYSVVMSGEVGTLGWGLSTTSLTTLEVLQDKLTADSGYMDLAAEGAKYVQQNPTDSLVRILYADPTVNPDRTQYISAGTAVAAPGQVARAAEVGIEIAQKANAVSGCPGTFGTAELGVIGTFQWATYFESIDQYEQGMEAINNDAAFQDLANRKTENLFEGIATVALVRKIA